MPKNEFLRNKFSVFHFMRIWVRKQKRIFLLGCENCQRKKETFCELESDPSVEELLLLSGLPTLSRPVSIILHFSLFELLLNVKWAYSDFLMVFRLFRLWFLVFVPMHNAPNLKQKSEMRGREPEKKRA